MQETFFAKQKSLDELQEFLKHYQQILSKSKAARTGSFAAIHQESELPNPAFAISF